jgi:hypothetical protein
MDSSETMDNLNMGLDPDSLDNLMVEEEGYWREVKAIIGRDSSRMSYEKSAILNQESSIYPPIL